MIQLPSNIRKEIIEEYKPPVIHKTTESKIIIPVDNKNDFPLVSPARMQCDIEELLDRVKSVQGMAKLSIQQQYAKLATEYNRFVQFEAYDVGYKLF